jgi:hypothetical protein
MVPFESFLSMKTKDQEISDMRPVCLAYQPPANSTFLSEQTSHQQPARTSQQYSSLRTNQHQPSATSQPNRLQLDRIKQHGTYIPATGFYKAEKKITHVLFLRLRK